MLNIPSALNRTTTKHFSKQRRFIATEQNCFLAKLLSLWLGMCFSCNFAACSCASVPQGQNLMSLSLSLSGYLCHVYRNSLQAFPND